MVGVDHMGIDLRVREGMEMKTLRFPFKYPVSVNVMRNNHRGDPGAIAIISVIGTCLTPTTSGAGV